MNSFEYLEARALLAGDTWQNPINRLDVNTDGRVSPMDALVVINDISRNGSRTLSPRNENLGALSLLQIVRTGDTTSEPPLAFVDVNGDSLVAPLDALIVINSLNGPDPEVRIRLVATDLNGTPITSIAQGTSFKLEARVQDLRTTNPEGVFAAYADALYDSSLVSVVTPQLTHGPDYPNGKSGSFAVQGLIDEAGSFDGASPLGPDERLLWTVTMQANAAGNALFGVDPADIRPAHDVLLFGSNDPVPVDLIDYVGTSLLVTAPQTVTISINDVALAEGNAGTTNFTFNVTLSGTSTNPVTVVYSTADGTATAPSDYAAQTGTVTFAAGETSKPVTILVNGDTEQEGHETFLINLSNPANATIADGQAVGTILDDDGAPTLTINDVSVTEGNVGNTNLVFTVTLSSASAQQVTVGYATTGDTATAGSDFISQAGALTFAPGITTQTISVPIVGDVLDESDETFFVNLSSATGASLADGLGIGTILDDDGAPVVNIANTTVAEGNAGTTNAVFNVTLSAVSAKTITVAFATSNGTASQPADYAARSGTLTFAPGETSKQIIVPVNGDTINEANENFFVTLSNPTNAALPLPPPDGNGGVATGTITDDDTVPAVSINDVTVVEGNTGTANATFTVSLSGPSGQTVTVNYSTADGTATAPADYIAQNGVLTFSPGVTSRTITVAVNGDTLFEPTETFLVNLSNVTNATIADAQGQASITDDDLAPGLSISDASVVEGDSGVVNALFNVTLSTSSSSTITVVYQTADITASAAGDPIDYIAQSGTLTFSPGVTSQTISVAVNGDTLDEANETFSVDLSNPTNALIVDNQGIGTIVDDDGAPSLTIGDAVVLEGNSGTTSMVFTVSLLPASAQTVTVNYATANGSATSPSDYVPQNGVLTFSPGVTTRTITIQVNGDQAVEGNENFFINLTNPVNATIADAQGTGTILEDDALPTVSISDVSVSEAAGPAVFTVSLSAASSQIVTVGFATADNTANSGLDYMSVSGNLTFAPGETIKTVSVPVLNDAVKEGDETFFVNLSSPVGATVADGQGIGTISDDDQQGLSISNVTVVEGNTGTTNAVFVVSLATANTTPVTVAYSTANGTATAGTDYVATSGTLTFAPGTTSQLITVLVNGDSSPESDETFLVNLSNPVGASLLNGQGVGTIINDDPTQDKQARIRLQVTDTSGNPLSQLSVNDNFEVRAFVQDLRAVPQGVFSAYLDVFYNTNVAMVTGPIVFGTNYPNVRSGSTAVPGVIDEVGAQDGLAPLGPSEQLLFRVPFKATANGLATFTADPADLRPEHEVLLFGSDNVVPPNLVEYVSTQIQVGANILTINNVSVTEGNTGTVDALFTVTRLLPSNDTATVVFSTSDGTATAGQDYTPVSGTLTFAPGTTTQTIAVPVRGDTLNEANETFFVNLSNAVNATIGAAAGEGRILDDDAGPTVSIADASGNEGSAIAFTVTLSQASGQPIIVSFQTADATSGNPATAGQDYQSTTGAITFAPGTTQQTISINTIPDLATEPNETFRVLLTSVNSGTIADGEAIGTIVNALPAGVSGFVYVDSNNNGLKDANEIGIKNVTIVAHNGSNVTLTTVTEDDGSYFFTGLPAGTYSISQVQPGFFLDGKDTPGTPAPASTSNDRFNGLVIGANTAAAGFNFGEIGLRPEFASAFFGRRAFLASSIVTGEFGMPQGTQNVDLRRGDVWISLDGGWSGVRVFQALYDSTLGTANLTLYDNTLKPLASSVPGAEPAEIQYRGTPGNTYFLKISGTNPDVTLLILESLSISDAKVTEGNAGTVDAVFTVTLSSPVNQPVLVTYSTADSSAEQGTDYVATSGTLTFAPGEVSQTITVAVNGDTTDEIDETFVVNLGGSDAAAIADGQGVGTITDDDAPARLTINDVTVVEGNNGTVDAVLTVSLDSASGKTVRVTYTTVDNTARSGSDYTAAAGTLTFAPGVLSQTVTIPVRGDTVTEASENFFVNLTNPVNAVLLDGQGVVTITDDDVATLPPATPTTGGTTTQGGTNNTSSPTTSSPTTSTSSSGTTNNEQLLPSRTLLLGRTSESQVSTVDALLAEDEDWLFEALLD